MGLRNRIRAAALSAGQSPEMVATIMAGLPNVMFAQNADRSYTEMDVELDDVALPMANWPHFRARSLWVPCAR